MNLTGVKVGEEVVLLDVNLRGPGVCKVTAIGRKYATIDGRKFELATVVVADDYRHAHAFTLPQWTRHQLEQALVAAVLKIANVRRDFADLSDEQIRETTAALKAAAALLGGST